VVMDRRALASLHVIGWLVFSSWDRHWSMLVGTNFLTMASSFSFGGLHPHSVVVSGCFVR
jgi:hypothetical protein